MKVVAVLKGALEINLYVENSLEVHENVPNLHLNVFGFQVTGECVGRYLQVGGHVQSLTFEYFETAQYLFLLD